MIWLLLLSPLLLVLAAWSFGGGAMVVRARLAARRASPRARADRGAYRARGASQSDPPPGSAPSAFRKVAGHPVSIAVYVAAVLLAGVLCSSYLRAQDDLPRECDLTGRCEVGIAPVREWLVRGVFVPVAGSDEACRTRSWCTAVAEAPDVASGPLVRAVRNPPLGPQPEGCRAPCPFGGQCSVVRDFCQAKTDADCALTEACVYWGNCRAASGLCAPVRDDDCKESRACRVLGRCRAIAGACRDPEHLAIDEERYPVLAVDPSTGDARMMQGGRDPIEGDLARCRTAAPCHDEGACDLTAEGECVVGDDEDCKRSAACTTRGACRRWVDRGHAECAASCSETTFCKRDGDCATMGEGLCGAGTAADCEQSEGCRLDGRCALVGGACQATAEICAAWEGCRFDGRCEVEAGVCRIASGACERSIPCEKLGGCSESTTFEGCGVGKKADCAQSEVCKRYGWCTATIVGYWPMTTSRFFCFVSPRRER